MLAAQRQGAGLRRKAPGKPERGDERADSGDLLCAALV